MGGRCSEGQKTTTRTFLASRVHRSRESNISLSLVGAVALVTGRLGFSFTFTDTRHRKNDKKQYGSNQLLFVLGVPLRKVTAFLYAISHNLQVCGRFAANAVILLDPEDSLSHSSSLRKCPELSLSFHGILRPFKCGVILNGRVNFNCKIAQKRSKYRHLSLYY